MEIDVPVTSSAKTISLVSQDMTKLESSNQGKRKAKGRHPIDTKVDKIEIISEKQ